MKEQVQAALSSGTTLDDLINQVRKTAIEQTLQMTRGNQSEAAARLGMNRGTFRKYMVMEAPEREGEPMSLTASALGITRQ